MNNQQKAQREVEQAKQAAVWARTNVRLQKLPCDGVPRYKLNGGINQKEALTYSEAYDAVFKDSKCRKLDGINRFTPEGVRRLLALNNMYSGVAREFILGEQERKAKKITSDLAELDKVKEWYDEHDKLAATICTEPNDPAWQSEEECNKRDRMTALENMINASSWERTSEKLFQRKSELTVEKIEEAQRLLEQNA